MTTAALPADLEVVSAKPAGIPIRNLWHMLLYAWNLAAVSNRWLGDVEEAPTLDALFARILIHGVRRQIKRGLGRAYRIKLGYCGVFVRPH